MAIYPQDIDLKKNIFITGIKYPFQSNVKTIFDVNDTSADQGISDLIFYILNRKGERYFRPNIGTNITKKLFEKNIETTISLIKQELIEEIQTNIKGVQVLDITFSKNQDHSVILINIKILKQGKESEIMFGINNDSNVIYTVRS